MACRFEYNGKTYDQDGLAKALEQMPPSEGSKYIDGVKNIPDAPFKKSWLELSLKRMIRKAAEEDYDSISWTPGEVQAARYDLSKQIDELHYYGNTRLIGYKDGKVVIDKNGVTPNQLADNVGKEAADKLMKQEPKKVSNGVTVNMSLKDRRILHNADLKVGGEGMREFYDKMLPRALEKLGKEYGVKVKEGKLGSGRTKVEIDKEMDEVVAELSKREKKKSDYTAWERHPDLLRRHEALQAERNIAQDGINKIFYIDLPQKFKDTALQKGFPLFSKGMMLTPSSGNPFQQDKYRLVPVQKNPFQSE